ncbi:MAG: type II secretion system F family protein [Phycisphaeraceae bacterium]
MNDVTDIIRLVAMISVFGLIISVWAMGVWFWALRQVGRKRHLQQRLHLGEVAPEHSRVVRLWLDGEDVSTLVEGVGSRSLLDKLEHMRRDAGLPWPAATLALLLAGGVSMTGLMVAAWSGTALLGGIAAATVLLVFWIYINRRIAKRALLFDRQLVDAMDLAARSLRAGHPLNAAFQLIADEVPDPVGGTFSEICQQQELGVGTEEAIRVAAGKTHSSDMKLFGTAVTIQLRSGGNLAEMMYRLAHVIRDRMRLQRRVQVLTAQTQFSKNVLLALPFIIIAALHVVSPDYLTPMFHTRGGQQMLAVAGVCLLLGAWMMNYLSKIRY